MFFLLYSHYKTRVCVKGHQNKPHTPRILPSPDHPTPLALVLKSATVSDNIYIKKAQFEVDIIHFKPPIHYN